MHSAIAANRRAARTRGHVLGCIADYEQAEALAEQLLEDARSDGDAVLARARTRATFHRFADALTDLDEAQRLGADPTLVAAAALLSAAARISADLAAGRERAKVEAPVSDPAQPGPVAPQPGQS